MIFFGVAILAGVAIVASLLIIYYTIKLSALMKYDSVINKRQKRKLKKRGIKCDT